MTHRRLIEAAERLFVRKGFDEASVEEISETAGYSRGAFYSNFDNKGMRDRSVRNHLAELRRLELETYAASVGRYLGATAGVPADRPEIVALVLLAVAHGLGSLAIDTEPECKYMYSEAAKLVFDRMTASEISHLG